MDFEKKTDYDNKVTEIEGKIPKITVIAPTTALKAIKNEISNVSDLVKKQNMMQKYQASEKSILVLLVITNLRVKYLMQR